MKILGLVPARKGSRRVPGKNAKLLGGKPLVAWTFETAMACEGLDKVCLSTDDPTLVEIARQHGVDVPFMRPDHLCSDTASTIDVVLHALDHYRDAGETFDGVMLLQPTSPFRQVETLALAAQTFRQLGGTRDLVSVSPAESPPQWMFYIRNSRLSPVTGWSDLQGRSQDLEPAYRLNGSIYLTSTPTLRNEKRFVHPECWPIEMAGGREAIDIDTPEDWCLAELALSRGLEAGPHSI